MYNYNISEIHASIINAAVAAVSNLASAAGDWQSVSSRGRPHKSSQLRVEQEE